MIIILTDGDNTEAWDNSINNKITNVNAINNRTTAVCGNIKATGIKIYAIRVIDGNAALLSNCATNAAMYFDVQQASQLDSVFTAIAQNPRQPAHFQITGGFFRNAPEILRSHTPGVNVAVKKRGKVAPAAVLIIQNSPAIFTPEI